MSDIKLSPKHSCMYIDASQETLIIPDISLIIEDEILSQDSNIKIFKKEKKSSSQELF